VDGAGAGYNVVFAVILGSGVGAGIAVNGRAHHGPNNSGGEWGHNPLPFPDTTEIPGKPCYCGRVGCIETWCSGRAFEAQYLEHKGVELKAADIMALKRNGDHLANLLLPALLLGGIAALGAKGLWRRELQGTPWLRLAAWASGGALLALIGGLVLSGRDGSMATYAAMVLACAAALGWAGWGRR
jgi:hypothetical protein